MKLGLTLMPRTENKSSFCAFGHRNDNKDHSYNKNASGGAYWERIGREFPSLKGASSTAYYRQAEEDLFRELGIDFTGAKFFKTDLWNEAKNTEILMWASDQGAQVFASDISPAVATQAKECMNGQGGGITVSDVRCLPFADNSMDLVYSMGTIEHFPDYRTAIGEIFRILKPGGQAIVGVPNKYDPFLRPLMIWLLRLARRYPYGLELSFSPRRFSKDLQNAGFQTVKTSGLLFMPGWLRMLDLYFYTRNSPMEKLTKPLVALFNQISKRFPAVRKHGYLLAVQAVKPAGNMTDCASICSNLANIP